MTRSKETMERIAYGRGLATCKGLENDNREMKKEAKRLRALIMQKESQISRLQKRCNTFGRENTELFKKNFLLERRQK